MVKLEGGEFMAETVRFLVERGVPVCAHIGLTPQAVHQLGGYRVQGRSEEGRAPQGRRARALEQAGAALMVMEMVPATLAGEITASPPAWPTIGIGAGAACDGQVLVLHDLLGVFPGKTRASCATSWKARRASTGGRPTRPRSRTAASPPEHCY